MAPIDKVLFAIEADKPFFFWQQGYYINYNTYTKKVTSIALIVHDDYAAYQERKAALQSVLYNIDTYLDQIDAWKQEGKSGIELELAIHDRIVQDTYYTMDNLYESWAHNIIGFFNGKGVVCQGYALVSQMFYRYAGLESIYCAGYSGDLSVDEARASNAFGHAWNMVRLDGQWYLVDVTGDGLSTDWDTEEDDDFNSIFDYVMYDTFNLTKNESTQYHTDYYSSVYSVPEITSDVTYTYHTYFNLDFQNVDVMNDEEYINALYNAIVSSKSRGDYLMRLRGKLGQTEEIFRILEDVNSAELFRQLNQKLAKHHIYVWWTDFALSFEESPYAYIFFEYSSIDGIEDGKSYFNAPSIKVYSMLNRIKVIDSDATIHASGTGEERAYTVSIGSVSIGNYNIKVATPSVTVPDNIIYAAGGVAPVPVVTLSGKQLTVGTDYTVSYQNNKIVSTSTYKAKVIIHGIGNYRGTVSKEFIIYSKRLSDCKISYTSSVEYTGTRQEPSVIIYDGAYKMVKGTDYTIGLGENTKIGSGTITIIGKGKYIGQVVKTFTITQKSIDKLKFNYSSQSKTYNGTDQKLAIKIYNGSILLKEYVDYKVTYSNNRNAGTAKVMVVGIGNYKGTKSLTFKIAKFNISKGKFSTIANQGYTKKSVKPSIKIKNGKITLKLGTHFTVKYSNNVKIGKAKIVITGKGTNYTGTKTLYFYILPKGTPKVALTSSNKAVFVKWKKISGASGYDVYYSKTKNGTYKSFGSTTSTSFKKTKLTKGTQYYVKVRFYVKISGKKVAGTFGAPVKVKIK